MSFVLPTIPFFSSTTSPITGSVNGSAAITSGGLGRLFADISADTPAGGAATTTSLGTATALAAPAATTFLDVTASTASLENGGFVAWPVASAQAYADLSIFVEEFSATGAFIRSVSGQPTVVLDVGTSFAGVYLRINESRTRIAAIHMPVVGGRGYRIWLDSLQFVNAVGTAHAASNFTYDFGPLFFLFS
jgi:hypothetical protein